MLKTSRLARHARHAAHRRADRGRGGPDPRPRAAAGAAAGLDRGRHRRRRRVRRAARLDAAAAAGADARGRVGINDPVAILLVIGCIEAIQDPDFGVVDALLLAVEELGIGARGGPGGRLRSASLGSSTCGCRRPACTRSRRSRTAALSYGLADTLHGSGFLAVYLAGLVLGTASTPARRTIVTFHDGIAWVAQLALFLILGLLVFPGDLGDIALEGTAIAVATAVFARPLATLLVTVGQGFSVGERLVLGWAGLRGAVPVVFATFAVTEGITDGMTFFNVTFFVVLLSTVLQGTDDRAGRAAARVQLRRGGDPRPAGRAGAAQPARRRGDPVPGARGRRGRRARRARARAAARGAAQRGRARRAGDPAARLDRRGGGRPAARDRPPGGGGRVPRAAAALAREARSACASARARSRAAARR